MTTYNPLMCVTKWKVSNWRFYTLYDFNHMKFWKEKSKPEPKSIIDLIGETSKGLSKHNMSKIDLLWQLFSSVANIKYKLGTANQSPQAIRHQAWTSNYTVQFFQPADTRQLSFNPEETTMFPTLTSLR